MPTRETRRASKDDGARMTISVDGESYSFDSNEVDYKAELDLFNASKLTMASIFTAMSAGSFAPFMIAAIVFLARRSAGEKAVTFDEIAESIDYASEIDVHVESESEAAELPEGPAVD